MAARRTFLSDHEAEVLLAKLNMTKEDLEKAEVPTEVEASDPFRLLALSVLRHKFNIKLQ